MVVDFWIQETEPTMALIVRYHPINKKTHIARDEETTFCNQRWLHSCGTMADPRHVDCADCRLEWRDATNLEKRKADAVRSKVTPPAPRRPILTEEVLRGEARETQRQPPVLVTLDPEALMRVLRRCLVEVEAFLDLAQDNT